MRKTDARHPSPDSTHAGEGRRPAWLVLAALIALATGLRFWRLGDFSIFWDESASWVFSRHSILELLTRNVDHGNPPLYYITLGLWMRLFGESEAALRALSAVAGILSVVGLFLLGRELFGHRVGAWSALLLAACPIHVYYSQEARAYTALILLGIFSAWFLARALRTDRWSDWLAAAVIASLAFYVHYSGLLIAAFEAAYLLMRHRQPRAAATAGAFALLCLPGFLLFLAPTFLTPSGYGYWQGRMTLSSVVGGLMHALFGGHPGISARSLVLGAGGMLVLLAGAYPFWHALRGLSRERAERVQGMLLLLCYALIPVLLFAVISRVKPLWHVRYVLVALPAYLLLTGVALTELRGRSRVLLAGMLALLYLAGFARWTSLRDKTDWRGVVAAIEASVGQTGEDTEVFLTNRIVTWTFDYYHRGTLTRTGFPSEQENADAEEAEFDVLAYRAAGRRSAFIIHEDHHDGDLELRLVRRVMDLRQDGVFRQFRGIRVFAFGDAAARLGGEPLTPELLAHARLKW